MFALSRTGMERSHIKSCEISDLLGEVRERLLIINTSTPRVVHLN